MIGGMVHPDVILGRGYGDDDISIGSCSRIYQFATIEANVTIGDNCVIGSNAWIGRGTRIGNGTRIQHGAFIARGSIIGKQVFIGPGAILTDDKYPRAGHTEYTPNPPKLEDNCSIGAGAIILPGVVVGKGALVGAGAVVAYNVETTTTVKGVPASEAIKVAVKPVYKSYMTDKFYHD